MKIKYNNDIFIIKWFRTYLLQKPEYIIDIYSKIKSETNND